MSFLRNIVGGLRSLFRKERVEEGIGYRDIVKSPSDEGPRVVCERLFLPQRDHRIHPRRSARGHGRGEKSSKHKQQCGT
jgi:hypothetical protein